MAIPKSVSNGLISGVIGEISHHGPTRATSAILASAEEKNNLFGQAYTYKDDSVESVQAGGTGAFAGIMINPKAYRIETEYARNGTTGEFLTMGEVNVQVKTTGPVNTPIIFDAADGTLSVKAGPEEGDRVIGFVSRHLPSVETPNLCVLRLTEIPYPVIATPTTPGGDE